MLIETETEIGEMTSRITIQSLPVRIVVTLFIFYLFKFIITFVLPICNCKTVMWEIWYSYWLVCTHCQCVSSVHVTWLKEMLSFCFNLPICTHTHIHTHTHTHIHTHTHTHIHSPLVAIKYDIFHTSTLITTSDRERMYFPILGLEPHRLLRMTVTTPLLSPSLPPSPAPMPVSGPHWAVLRLILKVIWLTRFDFPWCCDALYVSCSTRLQTDLWEKWDTRKDSCPPLHYSSRITSWQSF